MHNAHLLGTEEFWKQMCRVGAIRLSLGCLANGRDLYFVTVPPEHVPGFLEDVINGIHRDLNLTPLAPHG